VELCIQKIGNDIRMTIQDNGKSFEVDRMLNGKGQKRLGLLGMRERVEMIGGRFGVESAPGKGTTITASITDGKAAKNSVIPATKTKN
jgi:signal transduction histidine kinase